MIKIKDFFDNPEELAIGAVLGISPVLFIGWWVLLTMPLCALFFRLGGVTGGDEWFRRMGVPFTLILAIFLNTWQWLVWAPICLFWLPLSLGYGIPDATDAGSALGAFWYHHTGEMAGLANLLTRLTIALALCIALIPLFWVNPVAAAVMCGIILVGFPTASVLI